MFSKYSPNKLKPLSIIEAIDALPSGTSAGMPFVPGVKKGQARNKLIRLAKLQWRRVASKKRILVAPCIAGTRRTLRPKGENKPRLIWAYPGYINVLESQFSIPVFNLKPKFIAWSINWFDNGRSFDRIQTSFNAGCVMNLDFSAFDSTVSGHLIRQAFSVVRSLYDLDLIESQMLRQLEDYFIHTPLAMYDRIITKHRGIPSGSAFTQLIGSIVNMIACTYVCDLYHTIDLIHEESIWLGDDSLLKFRWNLGDDFMRNEFLRPFKHLGLNVNSSKTIVSRYGASHTHKFLGREIRILEQAIDVDMVKLKAQALQPEFDDKVPGDAYTRIVGLAWIYGVQLDAWKYLLQLALHLKKNFDSLDECSRIDYRFLHQFGISEDMLGSFPNRTEILKRQLGINQMDLSVLWWSGLRGSAALIQR